MNNLIASYIRTATPIVVGAVLSWLATKHISVDVRATDGLVVLLTGVFQGLYYGLVRLFEKYVSPKFGWLLGYAQKPVYVPSTAIKPTA